MMNKPLSSRDLENLSAYLDAQLSPGDRKRIEDQLSHNPGMRSALEDLRRTRLMVRSLPTMKAPRNFTLKPSMLPQPSPRRTFSLQAFSFSAFSAIAALLLLAFFIGDFMGYFTPSTVALSVSEGLSPEAVALATSMEESSQQAERYAEATPSIMLAPQIDSTGGMGGGGGDAQSGASQPAANPDMLPAAKTFDQTAAMTETGEMTATLMLAPLNPTPEPTQSVESYAEPTIEYFPSATPAPENRIVFTPVWVRLIEAALALVVVGAGIWALILFRRNT